MPAVPDLTLASRRFRLRLCIEAAEKEDMMQRHDPVREIEISERSWCAMARETDHVFSELHRRVIDARMEARKLALDRLLGRIDSLISAA